MKTLTTSDRDGACGTGKTLVALLAAEALKLKTVEVAAMKYEGDQQAQHDVIGKVHSLVPTIAQK